MKRYRSGPASYRALVWVVVACCLVIGGCAAPPPATPTATDDVRSVFAQLADACGQARPSQSRDKKVPREDAETVPSSCFETGALPDRAQLASQDATSDSQAMEIKSFATEKVASVPKPVLFRYPPDSLELKRDDELALKAALTAAENAESLVVRLSVGRAGGGNAFEQVVFAKKRAERINAIFPPHTVLSIEFDPVLPDDAVRLEFLPAAQ